MKKTIFNLLFLFLSLGTLFAQEYSLGAIHDKAVYESLPQKAVQHSKALGDLPRSASLKKYAPFAGNQGTYGTCTAWATGYAARTIIESIALNRQDRTQTTSSVFSPVYVYKSISNDPSCSTGTFISDALSLMKNPGIPRRSNTESVSDFKAVSLTIYQQSPKFPIADYVTLYSDRTINDTKIKVVKKSLSEGKPVIICANVTARSPFDSFANAKELWEPWESPAYEYGLHAMCVVGYDDDKHGGAFEIQNSWGESWGDKGFIWVKYSKFTQFVYEAYEVIENLTTYKDRVNYSGFIDIELRNSDKGMPVKFNESGFYQTISSYSSGTLFRFLIGNDHPAYVYAFSADSATKNTARIFPLEEKKQSPALDYSKNIIAWPGEYDWIQMDNVTGTDYLVVLFAKRELDIDAIRARFAGASGSFPERVARAVGSDYVSPSQIKFEKSSIRFSASNTNSNSIMGLLLAIDHR